MPHDVRPATPRLARLGRAAVPGGVLALALIAGSGSEAAAQERGCYLHRGTLAEAAERPSPLDSASVDLGGETVKICYGSVRARDREIMGGLVPFGALWRTGANEPTTLHLAFPAEVAGIAVEPGSYSLYTLPGEEEWRIYLNANYERWGIPISQSVRASEVGEAVVAAGSTDAYVENMRFHLEPTGDDAADLIFEWERTRLEIPIVRRAGG